MKNKAKFGLIIVAVILISGCAQRSAPKKNEDYSSGTEEVSISGLQKQSFHLYIHPQNKER
ncbi:MAG: hypothetical protein KAV48_05840 [Methanomicrobia archaeon]|nr:hypothetical protein [Methanomicrobia archaeon]